MMTGGRPRAGFADPQSIVIGHRRQQYVTMCGRFRVGKGNLHVAGLVGAAMYSASYCGSSMTAGPSALRGSGPGQQPSFDDAMAQWVVLIAGSTELCN
jgi:hypothetical protein